jgi:hypothetical protein
LIIRVTGKSRSFPGFTATFLRGDYSKKLYPKAGREGSNAMRAERLDYAARLLTTVSQTIYHNRAMTFSSIRPLYALLPLVLLAGPGWYSAAAQTSPVPNPQLASKEVNARVEALLKKMTLDEKVGQLAQYVVGAGAGPGDSNLEL